jgi:hypothetical protein
VVAKHLLVARNHRDAALQGTFYDVVGCLCVVDNLDDKVDVTVVEDVVRVVCKLSLYATLLLDVTNAYTLDMYVVGVDALQYVVKTTTNISEAKETNI